MLLVRAAIAAALVEVSALGASAQMTESIGIRAQGMGGAFTAVADDSTATWWNPGGLAAGAYFNTIIETDRLQQPVPDGPVPAWENTTGGFSAAYPALGLSYYRLKLTGIQPMASTAGGSAGRQDQQSSDIRLQSLVLSQFGATVGQSLGNHLVVASTLKLVHGSVAMEIRPPAEASLDAAADLDGESEWHTGLDIGALARFGRIRLGLMVRNATEITFAEGEQREVVLDRHFRAGVALSSRSNLTIVATDVDVTTTMLPTGEERRAAAGVETWSKTRRYGFRGGVSLNTLDREQIAVSGGVSAAVRSGTYVDVSATGGSDDSRRGWGFALRVTF